MLLRETDGMPSLEASMRRKATRALLFLCTLVLGRTGFAQTTGTILGQVTDPGGAAVGNAKVQVENEATGLKSLAWTSSEGGYLIPSTPPGSYRVTVEASGFKTFSHPGVIVEVGLNVRVDATLQLGS